MKNVKRRVLAVVLSLCLMSSVFLAGCGIGDQVQEQVQQSVADVVNAITLTQGDNTGQVGKEYATKWFTFTVESMSTTSSIPEHSAAAGNILLVARISITNTSGAEQPFGNFDWFVDDDSLLDYIYPVELHDVNDQMMPEKFMLQDGESATYDVVIEFPENLADPSLVYIEADDQGQRYATFMIPIR